MVTAWSYCHTKWTNGIYILPEFQYTCFNCWESNINSYSSKDKDIIYVGTALGGIWKTKDGGRNWIPTSDYAPSLGIGALSMDPQNPNILYAGTGEGNVAWRN